MTFDQFCRANRCTIEEHRELFLFLLAMRIRDMITMPGSPYRWDNRYYGLKS